MEAQLSTVLSRIEEIISEIRYLQRRMGRVEDSNNLTLGGYDIENKDVILYVKNKETKDTRNTMIEYVKELYEISGILCSDIKKDNTPAGELTPIKRL